MICWFSGAGLIRLGGVPNVPPKANQAPPPSLINLGQTNKENPSSLVKPAQANHANLLRKIRRSGKRWEFVRSLGPKLPSALGVLLGFGLGSGYI